MKNKFIGLINPPKDWLDGKDMPYWYILMEPSSGRYHAGPFGPSMPNAAFYYYHSEQNESLASFMYMLHGVGENPVEHQNEMLIAISYTQALRRLHDRSPELFGGEYELKGFKFGRRDLNKSIELWRSAFEEEESVFVRK